MNSLLSLLSLLTADTGFMLYFTLYKSTLYITRSLIIIPSFELLNVYAVDDFREVSQLMLKTHMFSAAAPRQGDYGGRVEYLPVHWHATLHKDERGVDT